MAVCPYAKGSKYHLKEGKVCTLTQETYCPNRLCMNPAEYEKCPVIRDREIYFLKSHR